MSWHEPRYWQAEEPLGLSKWLDENVGLALEDYIGKCYMRFSHSDDQGGLKYLPGLIICEFGNDGEFVFSKPLSELVDKAIEYAADDRNEAIITALRAELAACIAKIDAALAEPNDE